jgi:hypothetical protein
MHMRGTKETSVGCGRHGQTFRRYRGDFCHLDIGKIAIVLAPQEDAPKVENYSVRKQGEHDTVKP